MEEKFFLFVFYIIVNSVLIGLCREYGVNSLFVYLLGGASGIVGFSLFQILKGLER